MTETDITEAGRAALAKLAALDALCEQQTRTIALTSERAIKAEKACDEVGIQLAACQARLRLAMAVVEAARDLMGTPRGEHWPVLRDCYDALRALDAVPGDALAKVTP
jgi:DNA-directed RNA polymerase specialized sigma24 family protein